MIGGDSKCLFLVKRWLDLNAVNPNEPTLQEITNLSQTGQFSMTLDEILKCLPSLGINVANTQDGAYRNKYLKYKYKYLNLKNKLI